MEYLKKFSNFTSFLNAGVPTFDATAQYLVVDTFSDVEASACVLTKIHPDGAVKVAGSFGIHRKNEGEFHTVAFGAPSPISDVLRKNGILHTGNYKDLSKAFNVSTEEYDFPHFASSFMWPIDNFGVAMVMCGKEYPETPESILFLWAISGVMLINDSRMHMVADVHKFRQWESQNNRGNGRANGHTNGEGSELTPRQEIILSALRRGHINSKIAKDLDFSESLIRQETVAIYRKLGITGRHELISE